LTLEVGLNYARYDRKQLTLNGFLAIDAIFLGSIAGEDVASDTFTYTFATRKSITHDLSAGIEVPMVQRCTTYQKGTADGSAAVVAEAGVGGGVAIGDVTDGASYRLFPETTARPEIALNVTVGMSTGQAPCGIPWTVLDRDNDDFIRLFAPSYRRVARHHRQLRQRRDIWHRYDLQLSPGEVIQNKPLRWIAPADIITSGHQPGITHVHTISYQGPNR